MKLIQFKVTDEQYKALVESAEILGRRGNISATIRDILIDECYIPQAEIKPGAKKKVQS